jgi:hypothetical protein
MSHHQAANQRLLREGVTLKKAEGVSDESDDSASDDDQ